VSDVLRFSKIQELIYELPIRQVMKQNVITIAPDRPISELKELLRVNRVSGVPVVEHGRLAGIISIEDMIKALESGARESPVSQHMTRQPFTVRDNESVVEAVKKFAQHKVGRLLVVDESGQLCGILTGGDITRGLLKSISLDYRTEEIRGYRARHIFEDILSDQSSLVLRYHVKVGDFTSGGSASSRLRQTMLRLGIPAEILRRVSISAYEAEMNLVIHTTRGGEIVAEIQPDSIRLTITDDGPGIPDMEKAMSPGFSTAPEWIRELGFGAGMGLPNIRKYTDEMTLDSKVGVGTKLEMLVHQHAEEAST
jgi:CBS domain-containing protein/anti-sigma regulatory factor (Ser/Thr protein kinase)